MIRIDTTPVLIAHQRCEIPDKPRQTAEKRINNEKGFTIIHQLRIGVFHCAQFEIEQSLHGV